LSYFSDFDPSEIERDALEFDSLTDAERALEILSSAYEPVVTGNVPVTMLDEKLMLFFRNLKNQPILAVSENLDIHTMITHILEIYFKIYLPKNESSATDMIKNNHYNIIFLDAQLGTEKILMFLHDIRSVATRRKTSVIIIAEHVNKIDVLRYKDAGTDNIIVLPLSTTTLLQKVYEAINADRKS
jgi:CheY-like chemotaxis protein